MIQVTPVVLCGSSGIRLWPLSRTAFPKQFLCLAGNESLFKQAAQRLAGLGSRSIQVAVPVPVMVSGEDHRVGGARCWGLAGAAERGGVI